ncbi:MAG TPA: PVC-type heme-binding CxxCH protein [Pirellulales bacterium]|jgi:glucose/arabinose dehydrogenase|nr:PVC-type heme-binding CxxCH protein [Pirellulales bacterium]
MPRLPRLYWVASFLLTFLNAAVVARGDDPQPKPVIPHGQSKMPGPALTPAQAIAKMKVPEGFKVELVASEPDIINPVAMAIDERGRFWITESVEYPRKSAGAGKDRIKILEDTTGSGKADKITVFVDNLNIPSGIQVGHGGVWVADSPDILFYPGADKDGKPHGPPEVIVTGFGRDDTHELPNSLTWGPDGYLYGLNGVFNPANIKYPESSPNYTKDQKGWQFTCALWRIDPRTKKFEVFCQGTSNPWGVTWDTEGSAFVSACVIDHLWNLVESGYYHRQGGPYPPFTWKIDSIVKYKHQQAAYAGIHYFDSDAYPAEYRDKLYMGNIHGNCINVDQIKRSGSTYEGVSQADFLTANDAWFMPVVERTGPDGCLYILDWYDQYHCYQDANRDPNGIDRVNGRLYRIRYKETPRAPHFDLGKESDDQLIQRLASPNIYFRDQAQRLLNERNDPATRKKLEKLVLDSSLAKKTRMHALWALVGTGSLDPAFHLQLLSQDDPTFRAWGVRAAGNFHHVDARLVKKIAELGEDKSPDVLLQVAIAANKVAGLEPLPLLVNVLVHCGNDELIPHIVWQNLNPLLEKNSSEFIKLAGQHDLKQTPGLAKIMPHVTERILAGTKKN